MVCMAERKMGTHTARQDRTGLCAGRSGLSIHIGFRVRHGCAFGVQDNCLFCATAFDPGWTHPPSRFPVSPVTMVPDFRNHEAANLVRLLTGPFAAMSWRGARRL